MTPDPRDPMAPGGPLHVALWDAINAYAKACGGHDSFNPRRMYAVVGVERAVAAALAHRDAEIARLREAVKRAGLRTGNVDGVLTVIPAHEDHLWVRFERERDEARAHVARLTAALEGVTKADGGCDGGVLAAIVAARKALAATDDAALADVRALVNMVRNDFEWSKNKTTSDGTYHSTCPSCNEPIEGRQHAPGCELAALLARLAWAM